MICNKVLLPTNSIIIPKPVKKMNKTEIRTIWEYANPIKPKVKVIVEIMISLPSRERIYDLLNKYHQ